MASTPPDSHPSTHPDSESKTNTHPDSESKTTESTPSPSHTPEQIADLVGNFLALLQSNWPIMLSALTKGTPSDRDRTLQLLEFFAGEELFKHVDFELTVGELNRVYYDRAKDLVELYVSPRLRKENLPYVDAIYDRYHAMRPLEGLTVYKYRSFHKSNELIEDIQYADHTVRYLDIGCQSNITADSLRSPTLSLVIYVKKPIADKILQKKPVTFVMPDGSHQVLDKWLPADHSAIDILLLNAIGEYNLMHHVSYIDFLPEGDPLIASSSVFTELGDLRQAIAQLDKLYNYSKCATCDRRSFQCKLLTCVKCKSTIYCSKVCQTIDYKTHKQMCN